MEVFFEYTLKTPVTVGERTVEELKFRRPKVKEFLSVDGHDANSVGADVALAAALSGESELVIQSIDVDDWAVIRVAIEQAWLRFFGIQPKSEDKGKPLADEKKTAAKNT